VLHKDLKGCAYFPVKPALKFIPTPRMRHMLLFHTLSRVNKDFMPPEEFVQDYERQM
jgi:hypothetical protein